MTIDDLLRHLEVFKSKVGGDAHVIVAGDVEGNRYSAAHEVSQESYIDEDGFSGRITNQNNTDPRMEEVVVIWPVK